MALELAHNWSPSWTTEDYDLDDVHAWSSFIFVRVEGGGFVFVIDPKFGENAFYKIPSGHKRAEETPLETAIHELTGETGIEVPASQLLYVGKEFVPSRRTGDHWRILFEVMISREDRNWMNGLSMGNEGEIPRYFSEEEFQQLVRDEKFFSHHYRMLVEAGLIEPVLEIQ